MDEYPTLDLRTQRPARGHYVYRFYDDAGNVLYVGSTTNFWHRVGGHIRDSRDWWPEVSWERTLVEIVSAEACPERPCPLPGHAEMARHEAEVIRSLRPPHNLNLTGYCRRGLHLLSEHGIVRQGGVIGCYTCQLAQMKAKYEKERAADLLVRGQGTLPI